MNACKGKHVREVYIYYCLLRIQDTGQTELINRY